MNKAATSLMAINEEDLLVKIFAMHAWREKQLPVVSFFTCCYDLSPTGR